jgi:hypothetical protein
VIAVDDSVHANTTIVPASGYHTIDVVTHHSCVWNACGQASGWEIHQSLLDAGVPSTYTEEPPWSLAPFENVYVLLGVYPNNHVLTAPQEQAIVQAVAEGRNVYVEGADCWVYDPYHEALCEAFGIVGIADGEDLQDPILGVPGTFTEGMSFTYTGTNGWVDQIAPAPGAELIFHHNGIGYGVAARNGSSRTVGLCFEFSGLEGQDLVSSRAALLRRITAYFNPTTEHTGGNQRDRVPAASGIR